MDENVLPFATDDPNNCSTCGLPMIDEEVKENTEESLTCRKCTKMKRRLREFYEHTRDEDYFENNENVPAWEWFAWRILSDAQDTSILVYDLNLMKEDKDLTFEDYRKVIEILAKAYVQALYDDSMQELPR